MSSLSFLPSLMMFLTMGGGGVDLMDLLGTEAYWKAKAVEVTTEGLLAELNAPAEKPPDVAGLIRDLGNDSFDVREAAEAKLSAMGPTVAPQVAAAAKSPDAEVAERATRILEKLVGGTMGPQIRRLMAIRTLGGRKAAEAVPTLRKLAESADFFTADYAREAIAAIEGKPFRRAAATAADREADRDALPADCVLALQNGLCRGRPQPLSELLAGMDAETLGEDRERVGAQVAKILIDALEMVGNVRVDCVTASLAGEPEQDTPAGCLILRGRYDLAAVRDVLTRTGGPAKKIDGVEVFSQAGYVAILPLSERRLAVVFDTEDAAIRRAVAAIQKPEAAGLKTSKPMADLIEAADASRPLWAIGRVAGPLKQVSMLAAFESLRLTGEQTEGRLDLRLAAAGKDREKVAAAIEEFRKSLAEVRKPLAVEAGRQPYLKPVLAFLDSVKVEQTDAGAVLTASTKDDWSLPATSVIPLIYLASMFSQMDMFMENIEVAPASRPTTRD